ncbi:ATP-binding cassette domain-containing protein [Kocuria rhizophila]|nr:ATP-binding cassette domain-containing protein [Kocuria rhizophila]
MTKVLAGLTLPAAGEVTRWVPSATCRRIPRWTTWTSWPGPHPLPRATSPGDRPSCRRTEEEMASEDDAVRTKAMRRYDRLESEFLAGGGYAAESRPPPSPATSTSRRVLEQPLHTLSGGQRRRVESARILFADADTMLLDEPTNHLDHDSVAWLRVCADQAAAHDLHDVEPLDGRWCGTRCCTWTPTAAW